VSDSELNEDEKACATGTPHSQEMPPFSNSRGCQWALLLFVAVLFVFLLSIWVFLPLMIKRHKAKLDEVPAYLLGIRTAEVSYEARFGSFLPVGLHPRSITDLSSTPAEWTPGSGFDTLGWHPDRRAVQATFQVEVLPDTNDFIAHAWVDADGDGVPAHFTVTKNTFPIRRTPSSVR